MENKVCEYDKDKGPCTGGGDCTACWKKWDKPVHPCDYCLNTDCENCRTKKGNG